MNAARIALVLALTSALGGVACGKHDDATSTTGAPSASSTSAPASSLPVVANPDAIGKQIYATRCATCHGATGHGDGPLSTSLNPKPRDYSDPAWQASVTDEQLSKTIVAGGAAVGKSVMMPANADLGSHPETLAVIVKTIRSFKR